MTTMTTTMTILYLVCVFDFDAKLLLQLPVLILKRQNVVLGDGEVLFHESVRCRQRFYFRLEIRYRRAEIVRKRYKGSGQMKRRARIFTSDVGSAPRCNSSDRAPWSYCRSPARRPATRRVCDCCCANKARNRSHLADSRDLPPVTTRNDRSCHNELGSDITAARARDELISGTDLYAEVAIDHV